MLVNVCTGRGRRCSHGRWGQWEGAQHPFVFFILDTRRPRRKPPSTLKRIKTNEGTCFRASVRLPNAPGFWKVCFGFFLALTGSKQE